jgi:hypothetical protein
MKIKITFTVDDIDCANEVIIALRNEAGRMATRGMAGTATMLYNLAEEIDGQIPDQNRVS